MIRASLWLWELAKLLYESGMRFADHEQGVIAGHIAYSFMLSVLPFLVFATALTGHLVGPEGTAAALDTLFRLLPSHVAQTLQPVIEDVTGNPRRGILTLAALGAVWAASNAVEAVRIGFNRAYDYDIERHVAISRLIALGVVLVGFVTFTLLSILIILAPVGFQILQTYGEFSTSRAVEVARYVVATLTLTIFVRLLHRVLPARRMRGFQLWPGIVASVILWVLGATMMSIYVANIADYSLTYGALAGVIITLLFLYLMGAALVFGAEINAVVNANKLSPPDLSREALIEMQKRVERAKAR